jgi:predicted transposase YbfD/YdcC
MKIYLDKYHLKQYSNETFEVVDEKSYVKARREILSFFVNGKANFKSLHLYKHPFTEWFKDLSEWIEIISPKGILREKHNNLHLPNNLSDDDIVEMNLIDIDIEPTEKEIIKHFLGQSLPANLSKIENIYILSRIVIEKKECFSKKYISKVWEKNHKLLSENNDNHLINILKPIIALDLDFCSIISEGIYCRKDSVYIENWLHDNSLVFRKYDINTKYLKNLLNDSSTIRILNDQFEKKILSFCTNRLINKEVLWSNLSGYYNAEIGAILIIKPSFTQEDVDLLFIKYNELLTNEQKYLLTKLIIPTLTPVPLVEGLLFDEQVEKWQNWAINSFIPYKFYLDNQSSELIKDELTKIEKMSECYSDWLFNNFNTIFRKDSAITNLDVIIKINEVLEQANPKIIWLIIDGFPAFYQPMLESVLKENGINKTKIDWSFAVLPTITEVCIPTMLSGKFESATAESNRNKLLVTASNHRRCTYTNKVSDFRQNISADVDIACIHTIEIDTLLHKSDSEFEDGREIEIKGILKKRIEQISEVIKSSSERPIKLVISTDHGATKCLENGKNIKNSKLLEAAKENPRERCFRLNEKINKENIDASEMYLLTKEVSRNIDDWAIARGYRYFGKNDSGYRHGGLSPEETIVPIMFCEISNIEPENLLIKYLGVKELVFGKTEREFTIQIKNTNATNIELIEVSILEDKNCIFELPKKISTSDYLVLRSSIKLSQKLKQNAKNGELELNVNIKYSLLGESIEQKYTLTVLTEKDEFGDFDF